MKMKEATNLSWLSIFPALVEIEQKLICSVIPYLSILCIHQVHFLFFCEIRCMVFNCSSKIISKLMNFFVQLCIDCFVDLYMF